MACTEHHCEINSKQGAETIQVSLIVNDLPLNQLSSSRVFEVLELCSDYTIPNPNCEGFSQAL